MVLYTYPFATRADRVVWTLRELDFSFVLRVIDPLKGENRTADFLAINPQGKVPVLLHNGVGYTESLAIMDYLNGLHPTQPLVPADLGAHYRMRQAMAYVATEIEAYVWIGFQATQLQAIYHWPVGTATEACLRVQKALPVVWSWLQQRAFVAGDVFTLADMHVTQVLVWLLRGRMISHDAVPDAAWTYLHRMAARAGCPERIAAALHRLNDSTPLEKIP